MNLREQFEKLHPVPEGSVWDELSQRYWAQPRDYTVKFSPLWAEVAVTEANQYTSKWQGFQSGHAAGLEQQAKRIAELESKLVAAQSLHDKTVTLYDYLLETDEEGLIHHATQMRDVCLAIHEYRNADQAFSKEPK